MLEGKVAVVIGASSKDGIGYGIAEALAKKKVNLVLAARRYEFIQKFATEFEKNYNIQALAVETDATNYEHVEHLFRETKKKFGRLDILVNALGVFMPSSILEMDPKNFITYVDTNYKSVGLTMLEAVKYMQEGIIVNISSHAGLKPLRGNFGYGGSKAAVNMDSMIANDELKERGIRVYGLCAGSIDTGTLRRVIENNWENIKDVLKTKDINSPEEYYKKILKVSDVVKKVINVLKNPDKYKKTIIKMKSFEF